MNELSNISVIDIIDVICVHSEKGRKYAVENRQSYGISFCQGGKIIYKQDGAEFLSTNNSVVFLPQGTSYSLIGVETGDFPVINFTITNTNLSKKINSIRIRDASSYIKKFNKLKAFVFSQNRLAAIHLLYEILIDISLENNSLSKHLKKAVEYINQNYSDLELSNKTISDYLGISEIYLRKLFVTHLSTTPRQYIINTRINHAKQLIAETDLKIYDISELCGFTNVYHFSRTFKSVVGVSPINYKNDYI